MAQCTQICFLAGWQAHLAAYPQRPELKDLYEAAGAVTPLIRPVFGGLTLVFGKGPMTALALQLTVSLACSPSHCLSAIASSRQSYAKNGALAFGVLPKRLPPRLAKSSTPVLNLPASSLIVTAILIALLTRDAKSTAWVLRLLLLLRQTASILSAIVARILYMPAFVNSNSRRSSKSLASTTISTQPHFSSLDL